MFGQREMTTRMVRGMFSGIKRGLRTIDVHTHMYTPRYMDILRKRTEIPKVIPGLNPNADPRLIILPGEEEEKSTEVGRPIGREYWDVKAKLRYMERHSIDASVISLANPWLDFVSGQTAADLAMELNDELENICEQSQGKLFGMATLPVRNVAGTLKEIERLKTLPSIRGVILGTPGAGKGLDDKEMRPVLHALAEAKLPVFLHPHYGVGNEHFHDSGHALFLALGFPFETTISVSRLIVSGALDEVPDLQLLVAHAGAALPSLIGRLDSCVFHDLAIKNRLQHEPTTYMKKMYFDAISYNPIAMESLIGMVGADRIMFGTDNPFFPPPDVVVAGGDVVEAQWPSTEKIQKLVSGLSNAEHTKAIFSGNAERIYRL